MSEGSIVTKVTVNAPNGLGARIFYIDSDNPNDVYGPGNDLLSDLMCASFDGTARIIDGEFYDSMTAAAEERRREAKLEDGVAKENILDFANRLEQLRDTILSNHQEDGDHFELTMRNTEEHEKAQ